MSLRSRSWLTAAIALGVLATSACGSGTDAAPAAGPRPGGTLVVGLQSAPLAANPRAFTDGASQNLTRQLFDSLVDRDPGSGEITPWLATEWSSNADATAFTFTLRQGVTFSDGTPLTADVVRDNFTDIVENRAKLNPSLQPAVANLTGARTVGPDTVEVSLSTPSAPFLSTLTSPTLGIVGAATLALPFEQRADKVVGTGPFTLESFAKTGATVAKRPGYDWASATNPHQGEALLDTIEFRAVPEAGVRVGGLQSGQLGLIGDVPATDIPTLRAAGLGVVARANPGVALGLAPILARDPLKDPDVRRAVSLAINRPEVRDTVLGPDFNVATSVLGKTTPGYTDLSADLRYDPAEAARLLDGAGWKAGADGVREKDGNRLSLTVAWFPLYGPSQKSLELIKAEAAASGIDLELLEQTPAQIVEGLKAGTFDFFWTNTTSGDGDVLRNQFTTAGPNFYKLADPELETLLQRQLAEQDPTARQRTLTEIQTRVVDQALHIPVYELTTVFGTGPEVNAEGLALTALSGLPQLTGIGLSSS